MVVVVVAGCMDVWILLEWRTEEDEFSVSHRQTTLYGCWEDTVGLCVHQVLVEYDITNTKPIKYNAFRNFHPVKVFRYYKKENDLWMKNF